MKRGWLAPLVVIGAAVLMLGSVPAGAKPAAAPQARVKLNNLTVLDNHGVPIPGVSGVVYCAGTDPCQEAQADQHGNVTPFFVNPNVQYQVFGFGRNTGWACGGFPFQGALWWFGASINVSGRDLARPTGFVVARPDCGITLHVLRADNHQPFAPGGNNSGALVRICPAVGCIEQGPGANVIFPQADANGDVGVPALNPDTEYSFQAMAVNVPGWSCPDYTDLQANPPINYWFGPLREPFKYDVIGTPADLDNTTFYIADCA